MLTTQLNYLGFYLLLLESFRAYLLVLRTFTQNITFFLVFCFRILAVCTVLGLEEGKDCIIVGTLYKHMKLKPSILDEYSKEV